MICPGSLTAIVGLNGCGKSTLLKTLAGFLPPVSGRLRWQGKRPVIGWLAQRHALESQFPLNVQDVVSQGAWPGVSLLLRSGAAPGDASARCWSGSGWRAGENADRSALRRPVSAHAICPGDGAAGAAGDARRALHRYRRSDQSRTNGFDPRDAPAGQTILAVLHDNQRVADFFPETLLLTPQRACWGATRAVLPAFSHVRSA